MSRSQSLNDGTAGVLRTTPFLYAVIDLATAKEIRPLIDRQVGSTAVTLFAQDQPRALLHVGPWLVRLSKAPEIASALSQYDRHVAWGYYVHSTFDILSLRKSLRYFNLAQIPPDRKEVLFRYWDPRVMRLFLEVASQHQRQRLFELIEQIDIGSSSYFPEAGQS